MWLRFCGLESDWLAAGGYESLARSCGGLARARKKSGLGVSFTVQPREIPTKAKFPQSSLSTLLLSTHPRAKMMTTAAIPRTPLGDVSNKENLVPMKSKNQAPSLPIDTENGFQQVCSVLYS